MSRRAEIQVGATVLAALAILIFGVAWLKDYAVQRDTQLYHVTFPQGGGLSPSDEVLVNGLRRGEVKAMRLEGDHVVVDLVLAKEIVLTTDSRIAIRNVGMMGERVIAVDLRTTGRRYRPGEPVAGIYEMGLGEVMGSVGSTVDAVSSISVQLQKLSESMSDGRLANTIANFNSTSEELKLVVAENRASLRATLQNFSAASQTAKHLTTDREAQIAKSLDHFSSAAANLDRLSNRLDSLRTTLQAMTNRVERGQGTLGKLMRDEKLYNDLNTSVKSLQALIEDVKKNPKKYLKISIF